LRNSRRKRWAGDVKRKEKTKCIEKSEGRRPLGRPQRRKRLELKGMLKIGL
jgi:hypothetical protein